MSFRAGAELHDIHLDTPRHGSIRRGLFQEDMSTILKILGCAALPEAPARPWSRAFRQAPGMARGGALPSFCQGSVRFPG
ncbi:hypothetical protein HMPREF3150_01894 [Pseudomonas aeruginosa]|nr:hypothetical protein HMPREF3150_01894 [Pseudomonas aeruginosa]